MSNKEIFDKTYEKPNAIWTNKKPPKELVELIDSGKVKPCKVLDVGCGEGFYSIYLAKKGFNVTGVDISEKAIEYAKENAKKEGVNVDFICMNALDLDKLDDKFDFILEWALLHSIMKEDRAKYVENINKILNENGKYFSVCFNEKSPKFGGPRQGERIIPEGARALVGSKLYFSSLDELKDLFNKYFDIIESKVFQHEAGGAISFLNYFFMEKK